MLRRHQRSPTGLEDLFTVAWWDQRGAGLSYSSSSPRTTEQVTSLDVPTYLLHGVFERTCSDDLARHYFHRLQAPVKGFYTFRHSAHSPILEEPRKAGQIMRDDVLKAATSLADGPPPGDGPSNIG